MTNLLIADRIKTSLSESALKHVLTIESASDVDWLIPDDLCNVLDIYYANYTIEDRPRAQRSVLQTPDMGIMIGVSFRGETANGMLRLLGKTRLRPAHNRLQLRRKVRPWSSLVTSILCAVVLIASRRLI